MNDSRTSVNTRQTLALSHDSWGPRVGGGAATVADLGESGVLAAITPWLAPADVEVGPGDDAAVLSQRVGRTVVTTDSMVLGLDWRDDWSSAHDVGVKLAAQNIADIMAMGARPTGVVVALAAENATRVDWLEELTRGMSQELRRAGCGSLGGDLSGAPDGVVVLTMTALGVLESGREPFLRTEAREGDVVVVSDVLGRSHAGLLLLQDDGESAESRRGDGFMGISSPFALECLAFHRAPRPRYDAAQEARGAGVRCAMDISDGLVRDAERLAVASHVDLDLDPAALERMAEPYLDLVGDRATECVLAGGEEHALLATCSPSSVPSGWHVLGEVTAPRARPRVRLGGAEVAPLGWAHYDTQC